jgi:hypothetical protein
MRTIFYHNSVEIYDVPKYSELRARARKKKFNNRALGLFASTQRVGLDHYGDQQYQFQLNFNSTIIEVDPRVLQSSASWDYFCGLRRGWMTSGVDAIKYRGDKAAADWDLVVLNFAAIEHWDRMRWENAFFQGMPKAERERLLLLSKTGDLDALSAAFCCRLAPLGSIFWIDQYDRLDNGRPLLPMALRALDHALEVSSKMEF